jgi:hypothetical protein
MFLASKANPMKVWDYLKSVKMWSSDFAVIVIGIICIALGAIAIILAPLHRPNLPQTISRVDPVTHQVYIYTRNGL